MSHVLIASFTAREKEGSMRMKKKMAYVMPWVTCHLSAHVECHVSPTSGLCYGKEIKCEG
jgi:hypothetical protein